MAATLSPTVPSTVSTLQGCLDTSSGRARSCGGAQGGQSASELHCLRWECHHTERMLQSNPLWNMMDRAIELSCCPELLGDMRTRVGWRHAGRGACLIRLQRHNAHIRARVGAHAADGRTPLAQNASHLRKWGRASMPLACCLRVGLVLLLVSQVLTLSAG